MPEKTYTEAEVHALLNPTASGLDAIAARPYQTIKASDGQVLCTPPSEGGPIALNGVHPNDFYGAGADGVATKNV